MTNSSIDEAITLTGTDAALVFRADGHAELHCPDMSDPDQICPPHVAFLTACMIRVNDTAFTAGMLAFLDDLSQAREEARFVLPPEPGSIWQHRKGGTYVVVGVIDEEVGYVSLEAPDLKWYRSMEEFLDGRFTPLHDEPTRQFDDLGYRRG